MSSGHQPKITKGQAAYSHQVGVKEVRKLRARKRAGRSIWLGLGAVGIIGWSVAVPTLVGVALGLWLDHRHPGEHSWTLSFMIAGLVVGCWIAWNWVARENTEIKKD